MRTFKLITVNVISALRLLMAVYVYTLIIENHWTSAAIWLVVGGFGSDLLDGFLAKRWGVATEFGYHLDGQSDRVLLVSPLIGMMVAGDLWIWFGVVLILGVWVADALSGSFELMRAVWWPIIYSTIAWGLISHTPARVTIFILVLVVAVFAIVLVVKRQEAARVIHKLLG